MRQSFFWLYLLRLATAFQYWTMTKMLLEDPEHISLIQPDNSACLRYLHLVSRIEALNYIPEHHIDSTHQFYCHFHISIDEILRLLLLVSYVDAIYIYSNCLAHLLNLLVKYLKPRQYNSRLNANFGAAPILLLLDQIVALSILPLYHSGN